MSGRQSTHKPTSGTESTTEAALRDLRDAHGAVLLSFLLRLTRNDRDRAEDILQETMIRAWRHPEARGADGAWSRPWLFTVARRIFIDQQRAATSRVTELSDVRLDSRPDETDLLEQSINVAEVRSALESLPDRLRDVLVEVYLRDRSVGEAAETLDIPAGTVKSRTFYAMRALREALIQRGFDLPAR
ncbi:sigma-70 family RNA polymerase sigma factor [Rhizomonospora bruguierae]|uniref:sigma-70 family RNA polymerase sigma factor n=1 Tax=Rhizomonospora bruguierae TaxID=1581705 RepID=UPI001BCCE526|nr:sigma-70 family RNA polymerase sigma factor [Micromonospora sp. NBRC 107566]